MERRQFGRRTVFKPAIIMQERQDRIDCTVIDISQGGARIQYHKVGELPDEFTLIIEEDDMVVECRVAHRQASSIGVQFMRLPRKLSWLQSKRSRGTP